MAKTPRPPIYAGSTWTDNEDGSEVRVLEVTRYDVRYVFPGCEDIIVSDTRRVFLKDFTLRATQPNTTGALDE